MLINRLTPFSVRSVFPRTTRIYNNPPTLSTMSPPPKPYAVHAKFSIKDDRRDEFIKIIQEDQRLTLKDEPGAIRFVVGEDKDEKNTFYLHEEYISEDAFNDHGKMPHFKPWEEFMGSEPFNGEPEVDFYFGTHDAGEKEEIRSGHAVQAKLPIKEDRVGEFLDIMKEDKEKTLSDEKGSIQFILGKNKENANTFHLFEQYVDEEAFKEHNTMPHFKPWEEFMKTDPFDGEIVAGFYNTIPLALEKEGREKKKQKSSE